MEISLVVILLTFYLSISVVCFLQNLHFEYPKSELAENFKQKYACKLEKKRKWQTLCYELLYKKIEPISSESSDSDM